MGLSVVDTGEERLERREDIAEVRYRESQSPIPAKIKVNVSMGSCDGSHGHDGSTTILSIPNAYGYASRVNPNASVNAILHILWEPEPKHDPSSMSYIHAVYAS